MTIRPLKLMPHAQAKVLVTDEDIKILRSYNTNVAIIYPDGNIYCNGLYSPTTRKHISAFAREFGLYYEMFKRSYEHRAFYNTNTGELTFTN